MTYTPERLTKRDSPNLNYDTGTIWHSDNLDVMRGMNSATVDLIYIDPPFKKQSKFSSEMSNKAMSDLFEFLDDCRKSGDIRFAEEVEQYINTLKNKEGEIRMEFDDAWQLDDIKGRQLDGLQEKRPDIYSFISAIPEDETKAYMIFMGVRIIEMHRILKKTGSIYLHCDHDANSYLRVLLDMIFGGNNFVNEIIWHYSGGGDKGTGFPRKSDTIYFYAKSNEFTFNKQYISYAESTVKRFDKVDDQGNNYKLTTKKDGKQYRTYMKDQGKLRPNVWNINIIVKSHSEHMGYPTQKPVALLEPIILASSNEDDIVFEPFAGCATAVDVAYGLNRRWIACDKSYMCTILLRLRNWKIEKGKTKKGNGKSFLLKYPYRKTENSPPIRTDLLAKVDLTDEAVARRVPLKRIYGQELYVKQNGLCANPKHEAMASNPRHKMFADMEIDHIQPWSKTHDNSIQNLQLLCGWCNSSKGDRTMDEWLRDK